MSRQLCHFVPLQRHSFSWYQYQFQFHLASIHRLRGGRDGLNLDLRQRCRLSAEVCSAGLGVLRVVVRDGRLDGVLSKHGAMDYLGQYLVEDASQR